MMCPFKPFGENIVLKNRLFVPGLAVCKDTSTNFPSPAIALGFLFLLQPSQSAPL
jgi:hypothetical protein